MRAVVSLTLIVMTAFGCAPRQEAVNRAEEELAVKAVVNQLTTALESENMNLLSQTMAHDAVMVNFGTDAAERWVGWDALAGAAQKQFDSFEDTQLSVRDQVIQLSAGGDVAWFSEVVDWDMNAGGQPVQIIGSRFTGVLEKRADGWVCVQFHVSAPVAGQAARY